MSYLALDLDAMRILFKAENMRAAALMSGLRYENVTHAIFPVERRMAGEKACRTLPKTLTAIDMRKLWESMTTEPWNDKFIYQRGGMMDQLHDKLVDLQSTPINLFDLEREAGINDLEIDKFDAKNWKPKPQIQPLSVPPKAPSIPKAPAMGSGPSVPPWLANSQAIPSAPPASAPMAPPAAPKAPPSAPTKGATARVWEIADKFFKEEGGTFVSLNIDYKALRKKVIDACEAEGLNPGTAATQFGKWKASKGV